MGQVLRITFNNSDHRYQIVNEGPVSRETREIRVQLDGGTYVLVRRQQQWVPADDDDSQPPGLLAEIGRVLTLRYRI